MISRAPGRVNLLGEHTDYNQGFVLPCAIDRHITINFQESDHIELYSDLMRDWVRFNGGKEEIDKTGEGWKRYVVGVFLSMSKHYKTRGIEGSIDSNVPVGGGLSSSASLEIATALAILKRKNVNPIKIAKICRRAENDYVGVNCGIMDQIAVMVARQNNLLLLDCRSLEYKQVPFEGAEIVLIDSGTKHELSASFYNERVDECRKICRILKVKSLREAWERDLPIDSLEEKLKKRTKHFYEENERVLKATDFLKSDDLERFGKLMNESHLSLSGNYEVSTPLLDRLQSKIKKHSYGAKLTGAGFGGSIVAIVDERKRKKVIEAFPNFKVYFLKSSDGAWLDAKRLKNRAKK